MPCHDDREYKESEDIALLARTLNERTAMLCHVLRKLENTRMDLNLPVQIKEWWKAHKELDQKEGR